MINKCQQSALRVPVVAGAGERSSRVIGFARLVGLGQLVGQVLRDTISVSVIDFEKSR
jgi:hypothetical protein